MWDQLVHKTCSKGQVEQLWSCVEEDPQLVEARGFKGMTALHCAARRGRMDCIRLLSVVGADFSAVDDGGMCAVHHAASCGETEALYELLTLPGGPMPDTQDADGCTPLHYAAASGGAEAVRLLLAVGADAGVLDKGGRTPIDLAQGPQTRSLLSAADAAAHRAQLLRLRALTSSTLLTPSMPSRFLSASTSSSSSSPLSSSRSPTSLTAHTPRFTIHPTDSRGQLYHGDSRERREAKAERDVAIDGGDVGADCGDEDLGGGGGGGGGCVGVDLAVEQVEQLGGGGCVWAITAHVMHHMLVERRGMADDVFYEVTSNLHAVQ